MVTVTKPKERAKGTVDVSSVGTRRDAYGHIIYAVRSSDPRKQVATTYYVRVNAQTGQSIDCTCPDFTIWRQQSQDSCKHMDFAELDAKSKLLATLAERYNAAMMLLGNVETFLDYLAYVYPGPLDASDIDEDRQRLLSDIQHQKGTRT